MKSKNPTSLHFLCQNAMVRNYKVVKKNFRIELHVFANLLEDFIFHIWKNKQTWLIVICYGTIELVQP